MPEPKDKDPVAAPASEPAAPAPEPAEAPQKTKELPAVRVEPGEDLFMSSAAFAHLQRVARTFSESGLVPDRFRGRLADCMIALEMAHRHRLGYLELMQVLYLVGGKPQLEAKGAIAMINNSGKLKGGIRYRWEGQGDTRSCVAYGTFRDEDEPVFGPPVTIEMAKKEGWLKNPKWQSMPDIMLAYRAAAFFGRIYFSQVTMGMLTREEAEDLGPVRLDATRVHVEDVLDAEAQPVGAAALVAERAKKLKVKEELPGAAAGQPEPAAPAPEPEPPAPAQPTPEPTRSKAGPKAKAPASGPTITPNQLVALKGRLIHRRVPEAELLARLGVSQLGDILASRLEETLDTIDQMASSSTPSPSPAGEMFPGA